MTTGGPDRLKKLASDLQCVKCDTRPRLANTTRCRECLRADTERELAARPRLLAGGGRSSRKQAAGLRTPARKPLTATPSSASASKALTVVARPTSPAVVPSVVAEPVRELGRPYSLAQWQELITAALQRWRGANAVAKNAMAERSLAAETVVKNAQHIRVTYGDNPLLTLQPRSNAGLSLVHWALARLGIPIDLVDVHGDISDSRTLCRFCGTKVKRQPCTESQSRSCRNRWQGNR
jgi:hypothetical protein